MGDKELIFEVITTDDIVIIEAILEYNKMYITDFRILEFVYDEVVFARISVSDYKMSDIFDLGFFFHSLIILKRKKGEIDW